jgi:steroid delta-isomerase-like uncharacterized protein
VTEAAVKVVDRYFDALNAADVDAAVACVADDFVNEHTSALGHSLTGRDAYAAKLPVFLAQFQGLHYELEDRIEQDGRVAVPYTMSFRWVAEDGAVFPVSIRGMFRFVVQNDRIARRTDYWDSAEFVRQTHR